MFDDTVNGRRRQCIMGNQKYSYRNATWSNQTNNLRPILLPRLLMASQGLWLVCLPEVVVDAVPKPVVGVVADVVVDDVLAVVVDVVVARSSRFAKVTLVGGSWLAWIRLCCGCRCRGSCIVRTCCYPSIGQCLSISSFPPYCLIANDDNVTSKT